jgi:hypothetical protein
VHVWIEIGATPLFLDTPVYVQFGLVCLGSHLAGLWMDAWMQYPQRSLIFNGSQEFYIFNLSNSK